MLADGKAEDVGLSGQAEAVDGDIVRGIGDLGKRKFLEYVWLEGLSATGFWER